MGILKRENRQSKQLNFMITTINGASLEPEGAPMYLENFDDQIDKIKMFHQRWMPSNRAKQDWINRLRQLDIEIMAPQHGRLFKGDDVNRFLDWFEALEVGIATP